nr:hypothetical protein HmN_000991900 [Hymenolepis microstoma]
MTSRDGLFWSTRARNGKIRAFRKNQVLLNEQPYNSDVVFNQTIQEFIIVRIEPAENNLGLESESQSLGWFIQSLKYSIAQLPICSAVACTGSFEQDIQMPHAFIFPFSPPSCICHFPSVRFSSQDLSIHNSTTRKQKPRPYRCDQCGRQFSTCTLLFQHRRIHSGSIPYVCRYCERKFTQISHVQQHGRMYTGEKPYT